MSQWGFSMLCAYCVGVNQRKLQGSLEFRGHTSFRNVGGYIVGMQRTICECVHTGGISAGFQSRSVVFQDLQLKHAAPSDLLGLRAWRSIDATPANILPFPTTSLP